MSRTLASRGGLPKRGGAHLHLLVDIQVLPVLPRRVHPEDRSALAIEAVPVQRATCERSGETRR